MFLMTDRLGQARDAFVKDVTKDFSQNLVYHTCTLNYKRYNIYNLLQLIINILMLFLPNFLHVIRLMCFLKAGLVSKMLNISRKKILGRIL